jgi:hypothetical protein
MGSLVEELKRRQAAARAEADRLRSRIEELERDLAGADGVPRGWRSPARKSHGAGGTCRVGVPSCFSGKVGVLTQRLIHQHSLLALRRFPARVSSG